MGVVVGKIMPRPMGEYNPSTVYDILDIVTFNGCSWIAVHSALTNVEPNLNNTDDWMMLMKSAAEASSLPYDNTDSELNATNVQDAITEVFEKALTNVPDSVVFIDESGEEVDDIIPKDADTLGGYRPDHYATAEEVEKLVANLPSADGFESSTTTFNEDGSITEVKANETIVTTFNRDGSITETLTKKDGTVIRKTTIFNADDSITVTVE